MGTLKHKMMHGCAMAMIAALLADAAAEGYWASPASDLFADAALAPANVSMYLHIENASAIRQELTGRPIMRWLGDLTGDGGSRVRKAWESLARQARAAPEPLFDEMFDNGCTLLVRRQGGAEAMTPVLEGPTQWVLILRPDPAAMRRVMEELQPRLMLPHQDFSIHELPEHELRIARGRGMMLVSPSRQRALMDDVIESLGQPVFPRLRADKSLKAAQEKLGDGDIGAFVRHERPLGGWSAIAAGLDGGKVSIRHLADFEQPPFSAALTQQQWDLSPIRAMQTQALIGLIEPLDAGESRLEQFLHATLSRPLISGEAARSQSQRRITLIGERETKIKGGEGADAAEVRMHLPCIARVIEIKPNAERLELDRTMTELAGRMNAIGNGAYELSIPRLEDLNASRPGCISLTPAAKVMFENNALAESVGLNWTQVKSEAGSWWVIASDHDQLNDITKALQNAPASVAAEAGCRRWANAGFINGPGLATHLRTWMDHVALLAAPESGEAFKQGLSHLAELAEGFDTCSWQMVRPTRQSMELQIELGLSAGDSTRNGGR